MTNQTTRAQPSNQGRSAITGCSLLLIVFLVVLLSPLFIYLSLVSVGAILIVADPIEPVDAIVILSGDSGDRLAMAADMLERGYAYNLVITNTDRTANRRLAREAQALGFDRERIFITDLAVDSTLDESRAVRQFAQDQGWSSFMVVTDPYHSFRTRLIFRRELRGSGITISVRPVVGHWFRSTTWFYQREGWQVVFLEIAKLFNYLVFHAY
ncbi:MAG: YdcF family protein [Brevefilum sp.]